MTETEIKRYCCCQVLENPGIFGDKQVVVMKCWPAALDLGHCGDKDNATEDGIIPNWCCRSDSRKVP